LYALLNLLSHLYQWVGFFPLAPGGDFVFVGCTKLEESDIKNKGTAENMC